MAEREPDDEPDEGVAVERERWERQERVERTEREARAEREPRTASRIRRLGRRILGEGDGERPERERPERERSERSILGDAREVFGAVIEGSDKAKSEVVRAIAREVRNYLDELGLKDDLHNLLTNYSFEIHASVNLRRLAEAEKAPRDPRPKVVERTRRDDEPDE